MHASWNGLDWALMALIAGSMIAGFLRGVIRTLFGLAGWFCAFAIATWKYEATAKWAAADGLISSAAVARGVSYVAIAVLVIVLCGMTGAIVRRSAHAVGLGTVDRMLGGVLGAVRGALVGAAIVVGFQALRPRAELLRSSELSSYFLGAAHALSFVIPHSLSRAM